MGVVNAGKSRAKARFSLQSRGQARKEKSMVQYVVLVHMSTGTCKRNQSIVKPLFPPISTDSLLLHVPQMPQDLEMWRFHPDNDRFIPCVCTQDFERVIKHCRFGDYKSQESVLTDTAAQVDNWTEY